MEPLYNTDKIMCITIQTARNFVTERGQNMLIIWHQEKEENLSSIL